MGENYEGPTETVHLIRQAVRELGIGPADIKASTEKPGTYDIGFKRNNGDAVSVSVVMDQDFKNIVGALKAAYRGK